MTQLLVINSSPMTDNSNTRVLADFFVEKFQTNNPHTTVTTQDLGRNPPPHIDEVMIGAYYTAAEDRDAGQQAAIALSDQLVDQIEAADVIVIGSPMHNFSITSGLKAYIDHIARVGRTFQYTENGPEGLLSNKKVYVLSARGGNYSSQSPAAHMNFQDTYLETALAFVGLNDVTFINAEAVASGDQGLLDAKSAIAEAIQA